jgi:hypothetical protein
MTDHIDLADRSAGPDDVLDAFARRIAVPLRAPEAPDADFTARVMADLSGAPAVLSALPGEGTPWWRRRWQLTVTPFGALGTLAAAAALVVTLRQTPAPDTSAVAAPRGAAPALAEGLHLVRFELIAPVGARVSLVGGFNGWDREATTLAPAGTADAAGRQRYAISLALPSGRHEYAFVLDDSTWKNDPAATTYRDEFGTPTSVVVVEPTAPQTSRDSVPLRTSS